MSIKGFGNRLPVPSNNASTVKPQAPLSTDPTTGAKYKGPAVLTDDERAQVQKNTAEQILSGYSEKLMTAIESGRQMEPARRFTIQYHLGLFGVTQPDLVNKKEFNLRELLALHDKLPTGI